MGLLDNIAYGFTIAFQPINILYCFLGVLAGTFTGVLPRFWACCSHCLAPPRYFRALTRLGNYLIIGNLLWGYLWWLYHIHLSEHP